MEHFNPVYVARDKEELLKLEKELAFLDEHLSSTRNRDRVLVDCLSNIKCTEISPFSHIDFPKGIGFNCIPENKEEAVFFQINEDSSYSLSFRGHFYILNTKPKNF